MLNETKWANETSIDGVKKGQPTTLFKNEIGQEYFPPKKCNGGWSGGVGQKMFFGGLGEKLGWRCWVGRFFQGGVTLFGETNFL